MATKGAPLGNTNAKKGMLFREALNKVLATDKTALERVAKMLVKKAEQGEIEFIKELANRLDGRPAQIIVAADDDSTLESFTFHIKKKGVNGEAD